MNADFMAQVFWIAAVAAAYPYAVYPVWLFFAYAACQSWRDWRYLAGQEERRARPPDEAGLPEIGVVVMARGNGREEETALEALRQSVYPPGKLEVITMEEGHRGQVVRPRSEWLVFCDAHVRVDALALRSLARHFQIPGVGMVCGSVRSGGAEESARWNFESALDLMESRLGVTLPAGRGMYAVRRCCAPELAAGGPRDDIAAYLAVRRAGYKVVYDPEATATQSEGNAGYRGRARMAAAGLLMFFDALRTPGNAALRICFLCHRLLRWLVPIPMAAALAANLFLLRNRLYQATFAAQFLFYVLALFAVVWRRRARGRRGRVMSRGAVQG